MKGMKRISFDAVVIAVLHYLGLYMDFYWQPVTRGFYRDDTSISYEKQPNTISPTVLLICSVYIPMLLILVIDLMSGLRGWDTYNTLVVFEIGGLLVYVSNNLLKYYTGLQRPFFLSVCRPDYTKIEGNMFVADPKCTGDEREIKIAGLTFPSLHSSITAYGMTYFMTYLRHRCIVNTGYRFSVLAASLRVAFITWALIVFMSRILDGWHHPIDVISGALWGLLVAAIVITTVVKIPLFSIPEITSHDPSISSKDDVDKKD